MDPLPFELSRHPQSLAPSFRVERNRVLDAWRRAGNGDGLLLRLACDLPTVG